MKSLIVIITILAWVGMIAGIVALAAEEGTVAGTVTAAIISVTVDDGNVSYGSVALGATNDTTAEDEMQYATNTSNITANLNIKGTDTANWTLEAAPTGDQYRHRFATIGDIWTALTTNYQTLVLNLVADATEDFNLEVLMSADTTQEAEQNVNVWVQVVTP